MASQNKAGQRNRARKSEKERAGDGVAATARSGAAGGRTSAARETAPHGRSLTINIPVDRAIDVAKTPVSAARRVLSGKRGGIPVYVGLGVLAVADVLDPPLAVVTGAGYAALRRWGPLRPADHAADGQQAQSPPSRSGGE